MRVDAVVSLRHIIDAAEDIDSLKPVLPVLLNSIFHLMGEVGAGSPACDACDSGKSEEAVLLVMFYIYASTQIPAFVPPLDR